MMMTMTMNIWANVGYAVGDVVDEVVIAKGESVCSLMETQWAWSAVLLSWRREEMLKRIFVLFLSRQLWGVILYLYVVYPIFHVLWVLFAKGLLLASQRIYGRTWRSKLKTEKSQTSAEILQRSNPFFAFPRDTSFCSADKSMENLRCWHNISRKRQNIRETPPFLPSSNENIWRFG